MHIELVDDLRTAPIMVANRKVLVPKEKYEPRYYNGNLNGYISLIRTLTINKESESYIEMSIASVQISPKRREMDNYNYTFSINNNGSTSMDTHKLLLPDWMLNINGIEDMCDTPFNKISDKTGIDKLQPLYMGENLWVTSQGDYWVKIYDNWIPTTENYLSYFKFSKGIIEEYNIYNNS